MSRYEELKERKELVERYMDIAATTSGKDVSILAMMLIEIGNELSTYGYECAKCGALKSNDVTYQAGVPPFNIYKCNSCGDVVKDLF
jgi:hypothetical protein